ncbi:MAG TPA: DUF4331 family protein [Acidimicrobiales bacterium]|nr:DUF4331 family protein [Acidimicrobiales bacterium]
MSNHFSAANLKSPGGDARLDLTDLFVFQAHDAPDKTVLIMDCDPFLGGSEFHPQAVYRLNIDNNDDALADAAFSFVFSEPERKMQFATAYYATGQDAQDPEPGGEVLIQSTPVGFDAAAMPVDIGLCRMFVGVRSDPFFADADGALHNFQWTGKDTFAGKNVLSIAIEVPNDMLGPSDTIGVWMTVSLRKDGKLLQMDRGGNPSFDPILMPDDEKDEYNATQPVDDVKNYLATLSKVLESQGYPPGEARAAVLGVLPDILHFDRNRMAAYPNGRVPTDDVFTYRMGFLTHGRETSGGLKPHDDLLAEFPFLGLPNP